MRYRKLRIAWSVVCAIACVLLIALWVRSYRWSDSVHVPLARETIVNSAAGVIGTGTFSQQFNTGWRPGWYWRTVPIEDSVRFRNRPQWDYYSDASRLLLEFPHWLLVLIMGALTAAPCIRGRFSLRTLLIATTLVAVVLGLVVWAARK
jgi:hypothetical protein